MPGNVTHMVCNSIFQAAYENNLSCYFQWVNPVSQKAKHFVGVYDLWLFTPWNRDQSKQMTNGVFGALSFLSWVFWSLTKIKDGRGVELTRDDRLSTA